MTLQFPSCSHSKRENQGESQLDVHLLSMPDRLNDDNDGQMRFGPFLYSDVTRIVGTPSKTTFRFLSTPLGP